MSDRHLFLFGGSPPFNQKLGQRFSEYSLQKQGKVAILFIERDGWKEYMPKYTSVLEEYGVNKFSYMPLTLNPDVATMQELKMCSGIIICGGNTEIYRAMIVDTIIGEKIVEMYQHGVPVAGFSAGALISPETCVISSKDNTQNKLLLLKGLGLITDCVISVHFSQWDETANVQFAMEKLGSSVGYGIDDEGSIYFRNESLVENESENFYTFYKERS